MKKTISFYLCLLGAAIFILTVSGCMSISDSPSPRLYMPHSADGRQDIQKFEFSSKDIIGVGPVRIPEYLNRPQMVTRGKNNLLTFAQFDRWAEPLDSAILRMLDENLILMLPGSEVMKFSWSILMPIRYQVSVDIIQIESNLDSNLRLIARWNIFDLNSKELIFTKRSEIIQPIDPQTYFGLNQALSAAIIQFSSEIAQQLSVIEKQSQIKPYN